MEDNKDNQRLPDKGKQKGKGKKGSHKKKGKGEGKGKRRNKGQPGKAREAWRKSLRAGEGSTTGKL